ncbi:Ankyrin repeat domain-containing protein 26 [Merluccius polli]|uniref:Ankyrin repeat domain-containing protein 26 n=1 Tax=Merluccius polli TaxID=89951 RepID=A0AA47NQS0_MERPO|nr:Ankyrin repeat domain-containing protein 26 [Merluccius polli]
MPIGAFGGSTMRDELRLEEEFSKDLRAAMPAQRSSASWDAGGAAEEEERGAEKPEPESGSQAGANGSSPGEGGPLAPHESPVQRPAVKSPRSVNREPVLLRVPVQQNPHRDRDAMSLQGPSQLSMGGPRACSTPWTVAHLNGDPLSVFDDSTLSDLSDSEGRSPSACRRLDENMMGGEMELAEDLDELTQSSDTPTDDIESPASGYRHASMLIQKLDSTVLDSSSMVKLQNIFHEYENSIQKARGRHGHLSHKVSQLEGERRELSGTLEDLREAKSALERQQLELQTEVDNLRFKLKQEQENRRNASMLYDTGRDKLRRAEEHQQTEVEERQKVELALRSLELERRTLLNNMKQLEEDLSETQRLLAQERTARALQENLLSSHLRKQQEIEEERPGARTVPADGGQRPGEGPRAADGLDARGAGGAADGAGARPLRRRPGGEPAGGGAGGPRGAAGGRAARPAPQRGGADPDVPAAARLEHERQAREVLEAELESARTRLAGALQEAERCQAARADTEKNLLRERDEHQRLRDKTTSEAAGQRDAVGGLSQRLAKAETRANGLENEVHRAALQLTEKSLLLEAGQRERDAVATRCRELEEALRAEKELATRSSARLEATQERLAQVQSDAALLRQQLEEAQNKGVAKERAVTDAQERFGDLVSQLRADGEGRVQMAEDRSRELAGKAGDLRDQVYKLEEEKTEREVREQSTVRQLQQELADSLKKLSMSEASLEVNTRYRNDLEEEKARLSKDQDRLRGKLDESEDQYVQAERRLSALKATLDDRERQLATADQKLREALSTSAGSDTTVKQLEEAVQRLEIENARLEAAAKQQANKIEALQKGAHEATVVRGRLEDLVTDLQGSKMTLEDQLNREV